MEKGNNGLWLAQNGWINHDLFVGAESIDLCLTDYSCIWETQIECKWDITRIYFCFSASGCMYLLCERVCLVFCVPPLLCRHVTYMEINDFLFVPDPLSLNKRSGAQPYACNTVVTCRSHPSTNRLCSGNPPQDGPNPSQLTLSSS